MCANLFPLRFASCRSGGIGRRAVLRGQCPRGRAGSTPAFGTIDFSSYNVFLRYGQPIQGVRTAFRNACLRAGIKDFRFHDLRHTFASRLVVSGVDLVTVSKLLGHSSIQMTIRYAHPTPENFKQAVKALERNEPLNGLESVSENVSDK